MLNRLIPSDIPKSVELYIEIFKSPQFNFNWVEEERITEYFKDMYVTPKFYGYTFIVDNEAVGFCYGNINDYFRVPHYYIHEIFVSLKHQGKGIGKAMMKSMEVDLAKKNVAMINLLTQSTIPAFKFYESQEYVSSPTSTYMSKVIINSGK